MWDKASADSVFVAENTRRGICSSSSSFGCSVIRSIYSCPIQSELPWPGGRKAESHMYGHEVRTGPHSVHLSLLMERV